MFGYRGLAIFLLAGYLLLGFEGYSAQGEDHGSDSSGSDSSDNDSGYKKTYRSGIEQVLQALLPNSSSAETGESTSNLSGPLNTIISGAENVTKRTFGEFLNLFENNFHAIFPGTLWCGAGNISTDGDLGVFNKTDACCRAHDECPSDIAPGDTKGDLVNNGAFTRSACSCDHQFYHCLKNASTIIADAIGWTYFDILGPQCFTYDYPNPSCAEYGKYTISKRTCVKYNYDTSKNKTLIWVDNPVF